MAYVSKALRGAPAVETLLATIGFCTAAEASAAVANVYRQWQSINPYTPHTPLAGTELPPTVVIIDDLECRENNTLSNTAGSCMLNTDHHFTITPVPKRPGVVFHEVIWKNRSGRQAYQWHSMEGRYVDIWYVMRWALSETLTGRIDASLRTWHWRVAFDEEGHKYARA